MKNWLAGIAAVLLAALFVGVGTTYAADHDKITRMEEALPRIEAKLDNLSCYLTGACSK